MGSLEEVLAGHREAVQLMIKAAEDAGTIWTTPRAPGKWSASQVTEHVARALEESANVAAGRASKFPTFPSLIRPLVRIAFFNRVLKKKAFPKAKTNKPFDPESGPETPAAARVRLEAASELFERECRQCTERGGIVASTIFGNVTVDDYALFQELHTRNHLKQIPKP